MLGRLSASPGLAGKSATNRLEDSGGCIAIAMPSAMTGGRRGFVLFLDFHERPPARTIFDLDAYDEYDGPGGWFHHYYDFTCPAAIA